MARTDYLDSYTTSLYKRLYQNPPVGYTVDQIINTDIEAKQTIAGDFIKQSTQIVSRENSSVGGATSRTFFLHNISIFVDKDSVQKKRDITKTAKELIQLFENKYFDGLYCQEAAPESVGDEPNTNLYRYDVLITGYFEDN